MVRGRKTNLNKASSGQAITGHLDGWLEPAVDFLDGNLDASTNTAIQSHLDACPECAGRITAQRSTIALLAQAPLAEAPKTLEALVLEKVQAASAPQNTLQALRERRSARARRRALSPAGPWLPALAGLAAVCALVIALVVSHNPLALNQSATTLEAGLASQEASDRTLSDTNAGLSSTTDPVLLGATVTGVDATGPATLAGPAGVSALASPEPTGQYLLARQDMIDGLAQATAPAYFFFDTKEGSSVTTAQANTIASRLVAATGLQLANRNLSSEVRAFVAYVPRDDSAAIVDLLCSISDSLMLTVCLSLQPGSEVTSWAEAMLQDKYTLAELSASPSAPPAANGWVYTTSTSPTATSGNAKTPMTTPVDEASTHVLVVIFMAVKQ